MDVRLVIMTSTIAAVVIFIAGLAAFELSHKYGYAPAAIFFGSMVLFLISIWVMLR